MIGDDIWCLNMPWLTYIKKCFQTYNISKVLPFIPKFRFLLILIIILLIISLGNELMSSALFFYYKYIMNVDFPNTGTFPKWSMFDFWSARPCIPFSYMCMHSVWAFGYSWKIPNFRTLLQCLLKTKTLKNVLFLHNVEKLELKLLLSFTFVLEI